METFNMKTRAILITVILVLATAISSYALPSMKTIPLYPGAKVSTETNLTSKDFLPVIRQWLLMAPGILNSALQNNTETTNGQASEEHLNILKSTFNNQSIKELEGAISGLESISVVDYNLTKSATSEKVSDFYMQKLGLSKGWTLTLRTEIPNATIRLYTKEGFESFFGLMNTPGKVTVFRTQGKIDLLAISKWATKVIPLYFSFTSSHTVENRPATAPVQEPIPIEAPAPSAMQ
jgi:hypothetical protein